MYPRQSFPIWALLLTVCLLALVGGCGTTRTSNTARTATEQLLISDAIDRSVQSINFDKLAGQPVYFDQQHLGQVVDQGYLISSLRQHLLASGCILKDNREEADFVVEPRAGAIGTDNDELLFGIPATNIPQLTLLSGLPSAVPEVPFIKRRHQRGVAKLAVFAYRRETGEPIWQSGIATKESTANDIWVLGAGPFKKGTIHQGTTYADQKHYLPGIGLVLPEKKQIVGIGQEAVFSNPLGPSAPPLHPIPYLANAPRPTGVNSPPAPASASPVDGNPPIFPPPAGEK